MAPAAPAGQGTIFVAAALQFWSATAKAPPMTWEGVSRLQSFLHDAGRLNRWMAGVTAVSALLSAAATLLTATAGK